MPAATSELALTDFLFVHWHGKFCIPFQGLHKKLNRFLAGMSLHRLFASLVEIIQRFVDRSFIPRRSRDFGSLRPMMSQQRIIRFEIAFVILFDPFRHGLMQLTSL